MDGAVFISYSREDKSRIEGLVNYLSNSGIPVWWDDDLQAGQVYRNIISNVINKASCIVVVWSISSVNKDWVRAEADMGRVRGLLVPVLLDDNITLPLPFGEYHLNNLTGDDFLQGKEIKKLLNTLQLVLKYGKEVLIYQESLSKENYVLKSVVTSATVLEILVRQLGSVAEIMTLEAKPVADIRLALKEIEKTYEVVNLTISEFLEAITQQGKKSLKPFITMGRGSLERLIKKGHGHCTLILTIYTKVGGLRASVKSQLSAAQLNELDTIFYRLGTADGDLFQEMTNIAYVLTNESRILLNLLISGQNEMATKKMLDDMALIEPIEQKMNKAYSDLQEISQKIGPVI